MSTTRSCNECTACCEGWTTGVINDISYYPGKKCHFCIPNKGCANYANRPKEQCIDFYCEWLINEEIPEWFKPTISKLIIIKKQINDIPYISVVEAGCKIESEYLSWLVIWARNKNYNLAWMCSGGLNYVGSLEFVSAMNNRHKE